MFYNSQKGYGLKDLFRNITRPFKRILKPILKEVTAIGTDLAGNLIEDLVTGKTSKSSVKARGKQAKDMAVQRLLQGGRGNFNENLPPTGSSLGWSGKIAKRKRSRSKSQRPAKRKRSQSKSQPPKRKRSQTGGSLIYPHYPGGNYPGWNYPLRDYRIMRGGKPKQFKKPTGKRKPRKQTGGRRTGKKRKTRKQTGGRRTGKKRKTRKQTGGRRTGKKRKPRKQTAAGVLSILDDIFN